MPHNTEPLIIIVNGTPTNVLADENEPISSTIPTALQQTGNTGQQQENWELKDIEGNLLDLNKKVGDFHFRPLTKLFLSLKAGIGGC